MTGPSSGQSPPLTTQGKFLTHRPTTLLRTLLHIKREIFNDHVLMIASGLAFHAMLAVLPTLALITVVWRTLADPALLDRALEASEGFLPPSAIDLAREFTTSVPEGFGLGLGLFLNLAFILWTALRSANGLISALDIVFDETETRNRLRRILASLGIAIGGITFMMVALATLAIVPLLETYLPDLQLGLVVHLRWPLLFLAFLGGVGLLFSFGPSRTAGGWKPLTAGTLTASVLWMLISFGLNVYIAYAGSFGRLYGSISSVIVSLLWFYLSALAVLTGAEVDATRRPQSAGGSRNRFREQIRDR